MCVHEFEYVRVRLKLNIISHDVISFSRGLFGVVSERVQFGTGTRK